MHIEHCKSNGILTFFHLSLQAHRKIHTKPPGKRTRTKKAPTSTDETVELVEIKGELDDEMSIEFGEEVIYEAEYITDTVTD